MENQIMFKEIEYQEKKGVTKKQWWMATIPLHWISLRDLVNYSYSFDKRRIESILKDFDDTKLDQIKWIAVCLNDVSAEESRKYHTGYAGNSPITIRGAELPEVEVTNVIGEYPYYKGTYTTPLTSGQRNKLNEWFTTGLKEATNKKLLDYLIKKGKEKFLQAINNDLSALKQGVVSFEEYLKGVEI